MSTNAENVDREVLKRLVPPQPLTWDEFYALASCQPTDQIRVGEKLFAENVKDQLVYLLEGEIAITSGSGEIRIKAGTDDAKRPIRNAGEGQAIARSAVNVLRLSQSQIDSISVQGDGSSIHVRDLDESLDETNDWMTRIVGSTAFRRLPPAKIHALILRLQELPVRAGQSVLRQGDLGDNYYIILRGECEVVRENSAGAKITLARLSKGEAFGEESLLSSYPRNATVQMVTDGLLMSLPKRDFDEIVRESLLQETDSEETVELLKKGGRLLDVRTFDAHRRGSIPGSINIPLFMLRIRVRQLEPECAYICFCENERESVVAAFLLTAWGFNAYVLRGGLDAYDASDPIFTAGAA